MKLKGEEDKRIKRCVLYYDALLYFFGSEPSVKKIQKRRDTIFIAYIRYCFGS